jgi:hypothetical protein
MFKGEALGLRAMYGACRPSCNSPCNAQLQKLDNPAVSKLCSRRAGLTFGLDCP